jgi:hypothetical protein
LNAGVGNNIMIDEGVNTTFNINQPTNPNAIDVVWGTGDTLFGNGAGSTLNGVNGTGTIAAYAMDNVTVDLATGTATVKGSGVSDTLLGITSVLLSGSNDTLIGGAGATSLASDGAGNTLIAGTGQTTVVYPGRRDGRSCDFERDRERIQRQRHADRNHRRGCFREQ